MENRSVEKALTTYNIPYWGAGFFHINPQGNVVVTPDKKRPGCQVDLRRLADDLVEQGIQLPVLVRFADILRQRVSALCRAFSKAIDSYGYGGHYTAVYPIKVNQQRSVVEEIASCQDENYLGLEAGSKPELLAVLALVKKNSLIVCNGYKDREYIRLALIGEKLGHKVYIVIEKLSELNLVLEEAQSLGVSPRLGVRARLASQGKGKWQSSGGEKSKFGLSAMQILDLIGRLRQVDKLDALQLLHFHLGSQIANIRDIQKGIRECGRFYAELMQLGAQIKVIDVGGGLGVDYEGSRSHSACSANYSMTEYANNVVWGIGDVCREYELPHPNLISESGRAMTAHHAVLLADVIGIERFQGNDIDAPQCDSMLLDNMWKSWQELCQGVDQRALVEIYHDSQSDLTDVHLQYAMGMLNLEQRAWAEQIHLHTCEKLKALMSPLNRAHRPVIDELNEKLADKYFVNFSLFQSLPDAWGIDQVFPVMPISGLQQPLNRRAVMLDITCDSDGAIEQYVDGQGVTTTLAVPEVDINQPFPIGFFMVGAYQEILGNMHNLFGDTNTVQVRLNGAGEPEITHMQRGDSVDKLLEYVNLDPREMDERYRRLVAELDIPESCKRGLLEELTDGLSGYSYLEER